MINLLIVIAGLAILVISLAVGIVIPLGRATPGRTRMVSRCPRRTSRRASSERSSVP